MSTGTLAMRRCRAALMNGLSVASWVGVLMLIGCEASDHGKETKRAPTAEAAVLEAPAIGGPLAGAPAPSPLRERDPAEPELLPRHEARGTGATEAVATPSVGATDTGTTAAETESELSEPAPAQPGADGKTFTVDARLLDGGKSAPHCGILHVVVVMKLEVVTVIDGRCDGDTLYVYVSCPEMWLVGTPHRFEVGRVYRWTLDTRIERRTAGAKIDAFRAEKAPRYRLEKIHEPPP